MGAPTGADVLGLGDGVSTLACIRRYGAGEAADKAGATLPAKVDGREARPACRPSMMGGSIWCGCPPARRHAPRPRATLTGGTMPVTDATDFGGYVMYLSPTEMDYLSHALDRELSRLGNVEVPGRPQYFQLIDDMKRSMDAALTRGKAQATTALLPTECPLCGSRVSR
jgi:hypothetical protein